MMDETRRKIVKASYLEGFERKCAEAGVDPASTVKLAAGWTDLMGLVPGGGVIQGLVQPERGANRGETMLFGGGGSLIGAGLGGLGGAALTARPEPGGETTFDPLAALALASLGSGGGNLLGRWLARRPEPATKEDLNQIIAALGARDRGVTINMPGTGPSTELGKENGDEPVGEKG
jgi:hypothetical protein